MEKMKIVAATDGSCLGNPGVGGFAAVMTANGKQRVVAGCCKEKTTNNRMELQAVIAVVEWLNTYQKQPCEIEIQTDSDYIIKTHKHRAQLIQPSRANHDLWAELIQKGNAGKHFIKFVKVPGHAGHELNEKANALAQAEARRARHEVYGT